MQTSYEEKLSLYALYKQGELNASSYPCIQLISVLATEGDITISRPGLLDMLGRAKWQGVFQEIRV